MKANFQKYRLQFKQPGGTSRGVLHFKDTYFFELQNAENKGIGECNLFKGLSYDDTPYYEKVLQKVVARINNEEQVSWDELRGFPSIQFGLEQALIALESKDDILIPSEFTEGKKGIPINGLIWMGTLDFMKEQIQTKIEQGFHCLKLKIGTNWDGEHTILQQLRKEFSISDLKIRVDANGAFSFNEAQIVLQQLADLEIHSIEQPIKVEQWDNMAKLCEQTPTPIALDEELIGLTTLPEKQELFENIKPQYIILKPALVGGFRGSREWINLAEENDTKWWVTSALESNIGLNALAQWTYTLQNPMPQGLGTGGLFTNNLPSKLEVRGEKLFFNP